MMTDKIGDSAERLATRRAVAGDSIGPLRPICRVVKTIKHLTGAGRFGMLDVY